MKSPVYISTRVIDTINSLPAEDRLAVAQALTGELILGENAVAALTPLQNLAYAVIRTYVKHDTFKAMQRC